MPIDLDANPYTPPVAQLDDQRRTRRVIQRRVAWAGAIDGCLQALILDIVPLLLFELVVPDSGIFQRDWLVAAGLLFVYAVFSSATGNGLGSLLTRTRPMHRRGAWLFVSIVTRTVWPLFVTLGSVLALAWAADGRSLERLGRPDHWLAGLLAVTPWLLPPIAWLFYRSPLYDLLRMQHLMMTGQPK